MSKKSMNVLNPPPYIEKKYWKICHPETLLLVFKKNPRDQMKKKIKQAKCVLLLLQHQTSLWKEKKNQETERKAFF